MGSGFQDTGSFSKLAYLGIKNLAIGQSSSSCTYALFLPQGVEIEQLIFALRAAVYHCLQDTAQFSKLAYLGMKLGHWPKCQKLHMTLSFYRKGSKLSLFLLYWQRFWGKGQFSLALAIGQSSRSCTYSLSLPQRVKFELILALPTVVSEI